VSLDAFRAHCRAMADRDDVADPDRRLWTQLADEIDDYLDQTLDDEGEGLDLFT
jgi:hypothetical protein